MDFNGSYPVLTAIWLGVLTSISPCPLASNITALFYMAGGSGGARPSRVFFKALCYAVDRAAAYTLVAWLLAWGVLSVPAVANFLQTYLNQVLGPVLLIVGVVIIAILLSMGMDVTGRFFSTAKVFETWVRRLTAAVFFAVGGYYTWVFLISPMFPRL